MGGEKHRCSNRPAVVRTTCCAPSAICLKRNTLLRPLFCCAYHMLRTIRHPVVFSVTSSFLSATTSSQEDVLSVYPSLRGAKRRGNPAGCFGSTVGWLKWHMHQFSGLGVSPQPSNRAPKASCQVAASLRSSQGRIDRQKHPPAMTWWRIKTTK